MVITTGRGCSASTISISLRMAVPPSASLQLEITLKAIDPGAGGALPNICSVKSVKICGRRRSFQSAAVATAEPSGNRSGSGRA